MSVSNRITIVGSINVDLVFRTPRLPALGETISGHEFIQVAGGKGANQAVAAARQLANVTLIGCVGNDTNGKQLLLGLQAEHINTDFIRTIADCATGVAGIFVDDHGHNSIVVAPGANAHLSVQHIEQASQAICNAQLLICQCETPLASVTNAIELARRHGVTVVFNPAPAPTNNLPDELLAKVDYLIVNETEAGQLSGIHVSDLASATAAADHLLQRGVGCVLLTMGASGVCISYAIDAVMHTQHIPASKVSVVDTTAAGDTFVGAFASAIVQGLAPLAAAKEAQYCAALAVTKLGAQSAIPSKADVLRFKTDTGS